MPDEVVHLFFLDFKSYPIAMVRGRKYKVLETRTQLVERGLLLVQEIAYLVQEI